MINFELLNANRFLMPVCEKTILLYDKYGGFIKKNATAKEVADYKRCHDTLASYKIKSGHDTLSDDMTALKKAVARIKELQRAE